MAGVAQRHAPRPENITSATLKLRFPRHDLIGGGVEMLRQLGQRSVALDGGKATFALKAGVWFQRGRPLIVSPVRGNYRRYQAETPLIVLFRFLGPALSFVGFDLGFRSIQQ